MKCGCCYEIADISFPVHLIPSLAENLARSICLLSLLSLCRFVGERRSGFPRVTVPGRHSDTGPLHLPANSARQRGGQGRSAPPPPSETGGSSNDNQRLGGCRLVQGTGTALRGRNLSVSASQPAPRWGSWISTPCWGVFEHPPF